MHPHPSRSRRRAIAVIVLLALPAAAHGCSSPTAPAPPPAGGARLDLDFTAFADSVAPVLARHGCDAEGDCHGGGIRGSLQLSPPGDKDLRFDFDQVVLQVSPTAPLESPILTEPLAAHAGGTPHGVKPFDSTDDPDYRAIRGWIEAGVPR